jgi:hypothetical protein
LKSIISVVYETGPLGTFGMMTGSATSAGICWELNEKILKSLKKEVLNADASLLVMGHKIPHEQGF